MYVSYTCMYHHTNLYVTYVYVYIYTYDLEIFSFLCMYVCLMPFKLDCKETIRYKNIGRKVLPNWSLCRFGDEAVIEQRFILYSC